VSCTNFSEENFASTFKAYTRTETVGTVPAKPLYPPIRLLDRSLNWANDVEGWPICYWLNIWISELLAQSFWRKHVQAPSVELSQIAERTLLCVMFPASPSNKLSMKMKIGLEHRWSNNDSGNRITEKKKSLSHCHSVHNKSHVDWPGIESGPPRWAAGD
jgi:hypothetical protein